MEYIAIAVVGYLTYCFIGLIYHLQALVLEMDSVAFDVVQAHTCC